MSGYRPPYTLNEENIILEAIIKANAFYMFRGNYFWKYLSAVDLIDRSWQSLKERFLKEIFPNIFSDKYTISTANKRKIYLAFEQTKKN